MVNDMRLFVSLVLLLWAIGGDALAARENHCSSNDATAISSEQRAATSNDCGSITSDYSSSKASAAQTPDDSSDETSGLALKFGDHEIMEQRKHAREHELDQMSKNWSGKLRAAYALLRKAAAEFADTSSRNEIDQVGTGRGEFADGMYADEMNYFLQTLQASERGDFPRHSKSEFIKQDKKLNETYQGIMHPTKGQPDIFTGITTDGVRKAQRAWLRYRDAWVAFARLRYPSVPDFAWQAMLTEKRIAQLDNLDGVE